MCEKDIIIDMLSERILELKKENKQLNEDMDRLTAINRHYLHYFFGGDVLKMKETFHYLAGE